MMLRRSVFWTIYALVMLWAFLYCDGYELSALFFALCGLMAFGVYLNVCQRAKESSHHSRECKAENSQTETAAFASCSDITKSKSSTKALPEDTDSIDKEKLSKRDSAFDVLRVMASVLVIAAHVFQAESVFDGSFSIALLGQAALCCNVIYIMLSGALLLPWKDESIGHFYLRRYSKLLLPLLLYYAFYLWENALIKGKGITEALGIIFGGFLCGETSMVPFYWMLYVILSLYVIFPFLRYMLKDMPYKSLCLLSVIAIISMGILAVVPAQEMPLTLNLFVNNVLLSGWAGTAILGYFISRKESRRYDPVFIVLGLLSCLWVAATVRSGWYQSGIYGRPTPQMCLISMGLASLMFRLCRRMPIGVKRIFLFLSRQSLGVILIHWWAIFWPINRIFGVGVKPVGIPVCLISIAAAYLISVAGAYGVERLVMLPIRTVFAYLHNKL